jgi:hypothetical protein
MKLRKRQLRECARIALQDRGLEVQLKTGAGIIPGARLRTFLGAEERQVAVRTSLGREIGFARNPDGSWATIRKVDEVVVAVPSADDPNSAEVLGFDSKVLIKACDAALEAQKKRYPTLSLTAPIFVAVDARKAKAGRKRRALADAVDLKSKASWTALVPLAAGFVRQKGEPFIERVKREFAELNGVDVNKVLVEFKIIS